MAAALHCLRCFCLLWVLESSVSAPMPPAAPAVPAPIPVPLPPAGKESEPCKHCGGNHWHSECPKMGGNLYQASEMSSDFMKDVLANIGGNVADDGTFYYDSEQMATGEARSDSEGDATDWIIVSLAF